MHEVEHTAPHVASNIETTRPICRPPSISLILPAYNEAEVIANAIREATEAVSQITGDYEIIVVDDGSTDPTASIVRGLASGDGHIRLIQHTPNQGYGAALRTGFEQAKNDLVVFTDADCQFDLTELDRFVVLSARYDMVCGYRIDRKDSPLRCLYSKVYNMLVRALLGTAVRDVDCALKMFRRDVAKTLPIKGDGFLVNSEMLTQAKQRNYSIVEVGVSHRPRLRGESTVSVKHIPKVMSSLLRYWWNEVQFPSQGPRCRSEIQHAGQPSRFSDASYLWLQFGLLAMAAVFVLTNLGYPLIDRDETRYAEIPREMLATGNWILPKLNFQTYYDKPPLVYWLCAISFKLFGVSEPSARLVPAGAALLTLASTMFFGSRFFSRRIGLLAGMVLMLSVGFAFTSRFLLLDGVLTLSVALSLFSAYEAVRPSPSFVPKRELHLGWWVLSGVFMGLAFLTKGPIAIVLWLPPVLAMTWLSELHARPRWWQYGILSGAVVSVAAPWFFLVHLQDPTFLVEFFYKHNVARFAGEFHPKPIWYFVPVLLVAGHPWSFLTLPYARFLLRRDKAVGSRRPPAIGFLLLWSGWCFAFFSMSSCKLPTYLLPAAPALALMIGHYLNEVLRDAGNPAEHFFARSWSARMATATTCFAAVAFVLYVSISTGEATVAMLAWAMVWVVLLSISLLAIADRFQGRSSWGTSTAVTFLFAVMVMHQLVPTYSRARTLLGGASPLAAQLGTDTDPAIATIEHEFSEVPFYLNRTNVAHFAELDDERMERFLTRHPMCILVVAAEVSAATLHEQIGLKRQIDVIGQRGPGVLYRLTEPPASEQVAQGKAMHR